MNCNQVRELLPDVAAGMDKGTQDVQTHIASCSACAAKLQGFRQTMTLLDQWQTPEPSVYFDTRLGARFREELARPAAGWLSWLRRPVVALSLAAVVAAGALAIGNRDILFPGATEKLVIVIPVPGVPAEPGTAVGDLQALEKNHDLYADFDVLDELAVQNGVTANP
jgi:predicted anti-sigma-YlaC factor YlaD